MCNEWLVCLPRSYFLCLIMHTTISAADKWVISSCSRPTSSDACPLAIVAVVMNRRPMRFDRGGEVINQVPPKVICSAVRILRGLSPLGSLERRMWWMSRRTEEGKRSAASSHLSSRGGNYQNQSWHSNLLFNLSSWEGFKFISKMTMKARIKHI